MKRLVQLLVAEAIVVAALAVTLAALLLSLPKKGGQTGERVFSDRAVTDIANLRVENERGTVAVAAKDGGYVVEDVPAELVDTNAFLQLLTVCSQVSAPKQVAGDQADLARYGLDDPQGTMTAVYTDGEKLTLRLGSQESVSGDYYCAVEGEKGVYLIPAARAQWYLMDKEALLSLYVTPELAVSSALSAVQDVTFSGEALETPITIESVSAGDEEVKQLARSFGAATHIVRGAGVYELDQTYALTMLSPLCGMKGEAVVQYGLTQEQLDQLGFDHPTLRVEFGYKNGGDQAEQYDLRFLPATEDGGYFYVNAKGSGVVFLVARPAFMDLKYEKLLLRWFVSPLLMDVSGVTVESANGRAEFLVDSADARNPVITRDGAAVDTDQFRSLFKLLGSAASDGDYLGLQPQPEGAPVMTITYHYTEGKADDVLALYPGAARRHNVYVNGVCEFAMKETFAQRVDQALQALASGEGFDINW